MKVTIEKGLAFNSSKCEIKWLKISFCSCLFTADGIKPDSQIIKSTAKMLTIINVQQTQSLPGMTNFMQSFVT